MNLFLIRHAEPQNAVGQCVGQSDVPLSEKGKADVATLAERLKPIAPQRLISSDLARCRVLADALAKAVNASVEVKRGWREVHFGAWENQTWDDIRLRDEERYEAWAKDFVKIAPPEGESFLKLQTRVANEIDALKESDAEPVLVVTHAGAIRAALSIAIGLPLERAFSIHLNYGALVHLKWNGAIWTLQSLNNWLVSSPCDQPTTYSR